MSLYSGLILYAIDFEAVVVASDSAAVVTVATAIAVG